MIFNENTDELKDTAKLIENRMMLYEECGTPCHKESQKSKNRKQNENNNQHQLADNSARASLTSEKSAQ